MGMEGLHLSKQIQSGIFTKINIADQDIEVFGSHQTPRLFPARGNAMVVAFLGISTELRSLEDLSPASRLAEGRFEPIPAQAPDVLRGG